MSRNMRYVADVDQRMDILQQSKSNRNRQRSLDARRSVPHIIARQVRFEVCRLVLVDVH
jgi:hypothetical protein